MGLLDIFGGGTPAEKAQKLKAKITQKYGDPSTRQGALQQLGKMKTPEAIAVLMHRFTITVDPHTTDADEKNDTFVYITAMGDDAVAPVKDFLVKSEHASSWALKVLEDLVKPEGTVQIACELLEKLGGGYSRDPEKKTVLLGYLEEHDDPRIAPAALPCIEDHSDDVKLAALKVLGRRKHEPAREPILQLLTNPETGRRVATGAIAALAESGFAVTGYKEKVEKLIIEPWTLDKSGVIKKRS